LKGKLESLITQPSFPFRHNSSWIKLCLVNYTRRISLIHRVTTDMLRRTFTLCDNNCRRHLSSYP
jgi:hypothetical protein